MDYEVINDDIHWVGLVWHIKVDGEYYVVSRADTFDRGDETMIFRADENGEVTSWLDLYASNGEDHKTAIENWLSEL